MGRFCTSGVHDRLWPNLGIYYWLTVAERPIARAVRLLGPLEGRIMRAIWAHKISDPFIVRSIQSVTPELAYTTVMTTLNRLADKGLLSVERIDGQRAHDYRLAMTPEEFLVAASRRQVAEMFDRYGDAALAAFAAKLDELSPEQRERLRKSGTGD